MDKLYEELDGAKAEIEKLRAELGGKTDSLENLKKSNCSQVNQIKEADFKLEKLHQVLLQKEDEITQAKQICEDFKGILTEKESIIKQLSAANDKLRVNCDEKFEKWEDEKRGLVLALEEANEKVENQEQQFHVCRQEIENLKSCLSVSKKCLEEEKKSKACKELRESDDMFQKLEEENRKVVDQLKWKKEQFKHLEEAHEKLHDQFRSSKKEWGLEKTTLFDEISSLQTKLDSQMRISEDLQHKLQTCNHALAHEESRRKRLEVQVSDFKLQLDNVYSEYRDARLQLDSVNSQRDNDTGDLRYLLKTEEAYNKELKYTIGKLEKENQELRMSLKEFQEAQIQEAGASFSQSKLRNKLRNLEQIHRECASTLKAKEAEWSFRLEKLSGELNGCRSELENKKAAIEELDMQLESSHCLITQLKLELSVMLLVLKQGIFEAQLKLAIDKDQTGLINKEREEKISQLIEQLDIKNAALIRAQKDINEERERAAYLMRKIESFDCTHEPQYSLQNELDRYKEMLEQASEGQLLLEGKVLQMESDSKEKLREVSDALDRANSELDERIWEGNETEFELQIWKSIVERLTNDLEENHVMLKELETSLFAEVDFGESLKQEKDNLICKLEEKERIVDILQQQVVLLEQELKLRETDASVTAGRQTAVSFETDKVRFLHIMEEKENILPGLQIEAVCQEQESFRTEFESVLIANNSIDRDGSNLCNVAFAPTKKTF